MDVEQLANQLAQAQAKKTDLEQGVIRKRFELDDLEGQAEDVAEQMEQARKKTKSGFVNKPRLKRRVKSMRIV